MIIKDQGFMVLNGEIKKTVIMEAEDESDNRILWDLHEKYNFGLSEHVPVWENRYKEPLQTVCFVDRKPSVEKTKNS